MQDLIKDIRAKMDKALKNLEGELARLRTGRASTAMLDGIKVDYYGTPTQISQVASLSVPEPRTIVIQPWEVNILKDIEVAIQKSDLGINPMNDGKVIRLKMPDLTEQRRKDLAKVVKKIAEEAQVAVRMARREANDQLKDLLKNKAITEDDNKRSSDQVQKVTDEFTAKVEQICATKEKEILTI